MASFYYFLDILLILMFTAKPCASSTKEQRRAIGYTGSRILKVDCYHTLCPNSNATFSNINGTFTDCSFLDECQCKLTDEKYRRSGSYACSIQCPQLPALHLIYDSKGEVLSVECTEKTDGFNQFFSQLRKIIEVVNPKGLKLYGCRRKGVNWEFSDGCTSDVDNFIDSYDVSQIPSSDKFQALVLSDICFTDLHGNFSVLLMLLEVLDMSSNLLTVIPEKAFYDLHYLGELHLSKNRITTVTKQSFSGLIALHTLHLDSNKIVSLPSDAFNHLSNIEFLNLNGNQLKTLPARIFGHIIHVTNLDLGNNQLLSLPMQLFENMSNVYEISLQGNELSYLPDNLFDGLMQLENIDLNENELQDLPATLFRSNIRLRELDLSSNHFHDLTSLIPTFEFMGKLDELKLINNNITTLTIPLNTLKSYAASVDMSYNCLSSYHQTAIDIPTDYNSGKFSFTCIACCINTLRKELVSGVTTGSFENNRIVTVDMNFLKLVADMDEIDISYNTIMDVETSWEYPLVIEAEKKQSNTTIRLYHNPVVCKCEILPFLELVGNITKPSFDQQRSSMRFEVHDMYCVEPPNLRGTQLDKILGKEDELARLMCNITGHCPQGCQCYDLLGDDVKMLNCTSRGKTTFPKLGNYGHPIHLHLENNSISKLPSIPTWTWSTMRELYLDNNNLTSLENMIVFPTLQTLSLCNNSLNHLPQSMKPLFTTYSVSVLLSGNPWVCSCNLLEMRKLMVVKGNVLDYNTVTCVQHETMNALFLFNATDNELCPQPIPKVHLVKVVLPAVASVLVIICICAAFAYRYQNELKTWIYRTKESSCLVVNSRGKL